MNDRILQSVLFPVVTTSVVLLLFGGCSDETSDDTNNAGNLGASGMPITGAGGTVGSEAGIAGAAPIAGNGGQEAGTSGESGGGTGAGGTSVLNTGGTGAGGVGLVTCPGQGPPLPEGECMDAARPGVYAVRLDVPVYWATRNLLGLIPVVDAGRGTFRYYGKVLSGDVCEDGKYTGSLYTCGLQLPTFYSTLLCEAFETEIPNEAWDRDIAPIEVLGSITGFSPGDIMALTPMNILFGIDLTDSGEPWPTPEQTLSFSCASGSGEQCFPDYDLDGKPGITLLSKGEGSANITDSGCIGIGTDQPFKRGYLPLSADVTALLGGAARADELYIGFRLINAGGGGEIGTDCRSGWGEGSGDEINARAISCRVKEGTQDLLGMPAGPNTPCGQPQQYFIDTQLPQFVPLNKDEAPPAELILSDNSVSEGPIASIVRLGDATQSYTCGDVRSAPFPEP